MTALATALGQWRALLGDEAVVEDPARLAACAMNVTEYDTRHVPALLRPRRRDEVAGVVAIARAHHVPLYPYSLGRNWGVGSKLPVTDGNVLVDLGRLDQIRELSVEHGVAVVEPGVTQRQLADRLQGTGLMFNVTGSGAATSVVGNVLERGVGMFGSRVDDLRGLEVVTGRGEVLRTGLWHLAGARAAFEHPWPAGLGPDLNGLFAQSSLGIVTAVALALRPRQRAAVALIHVDEARLPALVDGLAALRRAGHLRDRIEIDADDDPRLHGLAVGGASRRFYVWVPLLGDADLVAPIVARVRQVSAAAGGDVVLFEPERAGAHPEPVRARLARLCGEPGDHSLTALARSRGAVAAGEDVDVDLHRDLPGFVCVLPAVPLAGAAVTRTLAVIDAVARARAVHPHVSFNSIGPHAFEGYVRVVFDRRDRAAIDAAHAWSRELHARLAAEGIYPLRLDVARMRDFVDEDGGDPFWGVVRELKRALDPDGVLSPGRYAPLREPRS